MEGLTVTIQRAIRMLREQYKKALEMPHIEKPLACVFTWPRMIGSLLAFGGGLTMILIGGYMEDDG